MGRVFKLFPFFIAYMVGRFLSQRIPAPYLSVYFVNIFLLEIFIKIWYTLPNLIIGCICMEWYHIVGIVILALAVLTISIAFYCFRRIFYSPDRQPLQADEYEIPPGKIYEAHREQMVKWMKETRAMPCQRVSIQSHDGLTLRGRYYEYAKGAPLEILFHGYQGNSERDLCGGVQRCFALGRNALLIDQRASGESDGHVISFGVNERKDCLRWIDFAIQTFGPNQKIMLGGISMGAATVLMTAGEPLPPNVICVLGDCGYSSQ